MSDHTQYTITIDRALDHISQAGSLLRDAANYRRQLGDDFMADILEDRVNIWRAEYSKLRLYRTIEEPQPNQTR